MKILLLFYMCHFAMGLTHCYKTTVFISPCSVWRDIKFAVLFCFVCLYGWRYLNAGWCDRREILAQGRENTRDGNEVVRGWSAHGGPWGGGLNFVYIEVNGEILRNPYLGNAWGDRHQIRRVYTSCAPRSILRFWGRSVEGGPSGGGWTFLGWGYSFSAFLPERHQM